VCIDDSKLYNVLIEEDLNEYSKHNDVNFDILTFINPLQALDYIINNKTDIAIIDILMPQMSGIEIAERIKELPKENQPFLVLVTSLKDKDTKERLKKIGANIFISKPYNSEEIFDILNIYYNQHRLSANSENEDNFFIDFDNKSSSISTYQTEKTSAKEFMQNNSSEITSFDIDELIEANDELEGLLYHKNLLDDVLKNRLTELFDRYKKFFVNFPNLYNGIEDLISLLDDLDSLDTDQNKLLLNFFRALYEDLKTWFYEVVINQTAKDIHYMDASFLGSIVQINSMLKM
jgi:DNA-binding response OmpR family regulator